MTGTLTRRTVLQALGALPVLAAAGGGAAAAGDAAPPPLSAAQRRLAFGSAQAETLAAPLTTLSGRLPPDLAGVLWRNGPAEHERFGHRYGHWFDGDGMVQAFTFTGDGVSHRARILETPKRRRETAAGRRLLPAFATLPPEAVPILSPDDMNAANTSVLAHGGRLMALWEGGSALAFDPETLEADEFVSWRPDLAGLPFSAHPKVEADGTCWNIGCVTVPQPMLLFYRIDPEGRLAAFNTLPLDPLGMVHDYVVTRRHLVLVISPFVVEPERFAAGPVSFLDAHVWRPELGTRVLVVEKETLTPVRRYELPPGFHFHHGNGWEEADGTIHLDLCQAADSMFAIHDLRAVMEGDWSFPSAHPRYRRMVLRPGGAASVEQVAPPVADFPRIDPRRTGLRHRALFALTGAEDGGWPLSRVARLDPDNGDVGGWSYPRHLIPEEHVFVPRGEAEADGWLVGPFLDLQRRASGLSVFGARHLADGPLWQGMLPYPLPSACTGRSLRPDPVLKEPDRRRGGPAARGRGSTRSRPSSGLCGRGCS